jgi:hypothetical protein
MNIGYFFWGHLSDKIGEKTKNTPDGNAWYSSSIIDECQSRGDIVYGMSINRDKEDYLDYGDQIFKAFETEKRTQAYLKIHWIDWKDNYNSAIFPELDILLLEWRFPIEGRNTPESEGEEGWQPDLKMQNTILEHYSNTKTKLVIFDLDHKVTTEDNRKLKILFRNNVYIFETARKPLKGTVPRVSVEIPFWMKKATLPTPRPKSKYKQLVYIGSRYERDESIEKYLVPYSKDHPFTVWFYGNWRNYPELYEQIYVDLKWRDIQYHGRVGHSDFELIYGDSIACPLIAKQSYYDTGFMTARIQECLYFGSIPIGFKEFYQIEEYLPQELIAEDHNDLKEIIEKISKFSIEEHNDYRKRLWNRLSFMDVSYFVDKLIGEI